MLPLHVKPKPRETLPSFLSRMAAANGCGPAQFSIEMGFSIKRVLNLEPWPLERLCQLAGIDTQEMEDLVSWTGHSIGNVRTRFRNEVFVSRALRNPTVRGCPACLREDAVGSEHPTKSMYMRGDWQLRGNDICLRHQKALVPLWKHSHPVARNSVSERLTENLSDIMSGARDGHEVHPAEYDFWLERRLVDGTDRTWLGNIGLYPAMTFCALLGKGILKLEGKSSTEDRAAAIGFSVAKHGPEEIEKIFVEMHTAAQNSTLEPSGVYGQLYDQLTWAHADDDAFEPIKRLLRSHIFDRWPVEPTESILGRSIGSRRIHSLSSAAKELNISEKLLDTLLTEAGVFQDEDQRTPRQKTFEIAPYRNLLHEIPQLVGPIEMQRRIGATQTELETLERDGVLEPRSKVASVRSPWNFQDGLALVERLSKWAIRTVQPADEDWITLQAARVRYRTPLPLIFEAIEIGKLALGRNDEVQGYHGFVVFRPELDNVFGHVIEDRGRELVPAAAFGRTIGLRGREGFMTFIEDGHTPATLGQRSVTQQEQWYLSPDDIAAFRERFLTPSMLASETGRHRNTIFAALKKYGTPRFTPNGKDYGPIYLRKSAKKALADLLKG